MKGYERYAKELTERGAVMRRKGKRVTYGDFSAEENEQMRLYNLTMKINRLELLKSKLGLTTVDGYSELRNYMGDKLNGAVIAESKRQAGILGEYSGVLQMDPKKAAAIVNGSFKGATFSQRLWKNQQELKQTLDAGLTSALIRGKSSAEVASLIRKHFTGDFQKAGKASLRLAVTEMARVEIEVQKNSFEKNGFEEYTFNATGPHPCDICQALDGKHFKVSEMMPGENAPPMHPWCYCAVSAYSDRKEYDEWLNSGAAANGVSLKEFTQKKYGWNKNGLDEFIPAKTIEEAEQYAKQFIGDGYSPTFKNQSLYKGISLENANEINKAIHDLYSKINMPKLAGIKAISPTSKQGKKVFSSSDAVAAYNPVEHGIFLNKDVLKNAKAIQKYNEEANNAWETVMKNINNLSGVQKEIALRYKKAGRALVGDGSVYDYIVHEIGHHVEWSVLDTQTNNIVGKNMSKYAPHISGYANANKSEYIAESFVAYIKGETNKIDPEFVKFMEQGSPKGKSDGIIISKSLQANRKTSTVPTVILPKAEYAHVMSEINTNMSDEEREQFLVSKAIGDYIYTYENYGFDNYRIIGKVPIDGGRYDKIKQQSKKRK